ncbi:MAG: MBL-fold metallo-hydrolase superfamily [uncultured Sphingomonadaceae bacterium]|uniref:MBL-fold metallo-hydrolase superfamily n=1 Tax=uncultured Sphingomonadaceae bacterium TaxID=169976 RepID=A0A6J4SAE7_9SPHN|nr:MAG: MBL-fold metallo-hydrolase superfamily [uncultured Sphingomonadaceae bacterium]
MTRSRWQVSASFGRAALAMSAFAVPSVAHAQASSPYETINAAAAKDQIVATPLRGGVTMLQGSGGNMVVLSGPDGLLMVDTGIAISQQKIRRALDRLGKGSLRHVVSTHWHWDHTDGNGWARRAGASIHAHPNTIARLSRTLRVVEWEHTFTPVAAEALPNVPVTAEKRLTQNGETIIISPYAAGHTDGDLSVRFVKADVLAVGDTWWNGHYPFIDYVGGGGIDGVIAQAEASIALAGPGTQIVPGHGPVGSRADLVAYRDMLVDIRGRVAALKAAGRSLKEAVAAKPTAAYDAKWGTSLISPALFTTLVYRGI